MSATYTPREMIERLIAFDTTSRDSNLHLISFVEDYAKAHGVEPRRIPNEEGTKANLLISLGPNAPGGIILSGHTDVVPVDGQPWVTDPFRVVEKDGKLYGRASAVSKSDFATYTYAVRALEALRAPLKGGVELHFTYDEEFGGELGPGWLLDQGLTRPDLLIAAGFSYQVVTAHNGCLQLEVTLTGLASHTAYPHTGIDALQAATDLFYRFVSY